MRIKHGVSALALSTCIGMMTTQAHASTAEDKRIEALEAQVRELMTEVHHLRSDEQASPAPVGRHGRHGYAPVAEAPEASSPYGGPPAAPGEPFNTAGGNGANNPPASSPDTPRPVSAGGSSIIPGASIMGGKPSIQSADGQFVANLHGVMQFDYANYFQDRPGAVADDFRRSGSSYDNGRATNLADGTDFRRARIGIDGKVFGDFEYNILFDFGGSGSEDAGHIQELWAQYSGIKPFHLRAGAFQPSIGLEDQNSTNGMPFLERPDSVDVARGLSAGDFREAGELWANGKQWFASGAVTTRLVGVQNSGNSLTTVTSTSTTGFTKTGVPCSTISATCIPLTSTSTLANGDNGVNVPFNQAVGFVGRVVVNPFEGKNWLTHLGVHGSYGRIADTGGPYGSSTNVDLRMSAETRVDYTRLVDTGNIKASSVSDAGLEAAGQYQNFYIEGEYDKYLVDRRDSLLSNPSFDGYYVEATYILTGERRKYNVNTAAFDAPPVAHPFSVKNGQWGAWEIGMRYSDLDLNYHAGEAGTAPAADAIRGGNQKIFTAGLNWYLNPIVRVMLDYQHVNVDRLSPSATNFKTPTGAEIGQAYNAVEVRTQLAF